MTAPDETAVVFPDLYAPWIRELLGGAVPAETGANCAECPMAAPVAPGEPGVFDRHLKCCTFFPVFPNYLVGRILGSGSLAGSPMRSIVEGRADVPAAVTPLGVGGDHRHTLLYRQGGVDFGRDRTMRCPFLADDAARDVTYCSVWSERQSTCTTYYCRFVAGRRGVEFWNYLNRFLTDVEDALRWWCALRMDLPVEVLARLDDRQRTNVGQAPGPGPDLWGPWSGRRAEYFERTADLVAELSWPDVLGIGGAVVELTSRLVREAWTRMTSDELPPRLRVGEYTIVATMEGRLRVVAHNPHDPVDVPTDLIRALHRFHGCSPAEGIRRIREADGLSVTPELVRTLLDQGILLAG